MRCESLASLRYFLHGLAERVGDIVQVVNGADKPRNGVGTTLPRGGVFVLFVKDKLTEDMCGCFVCGWVWENQLWKSQNRWV